MWYQMRFDCFKTGGGISLFVLLVLAAFGMGFTQGEGSGSTVHLELRGSDPAADTTLAGSPEEVRLFFSEPPQMSGTTVRLADGGGALVATSEAEAQVDDPRQVFITIHDPLAAGTYTVHWRVIAQDGHAQNGDFSFSIR